MTSYQKLSDPDKCRKKEGFLINLIGNLFLSCCNEIPSRCFSKSRILVAAITVSKRKLSYNSEVQPLWEFKCVLRIHMSPITCIYLFGLFFNNCFCRAWWLPMTNNSLTHILQLRASWLFCSPIEVHVCFLYYNEMTVTIIPTLCQHFIKHKRNLL